MRRASQLAAPRRSAASQALVGVVIVTTLIGSGACASSNGPPGSRDPVSSTLRRDSTGSVITAEEIQRTPGESVDKYINGRWPGVVVSATSDGGISVRIRGATSLSAATEPLYIVDGVPYAPNQNGSLSINPYDIASIRVLKDAADLSMYGVRGANGVVIIKTKVPPRIPPG